MTAYILKINLGESLSLPRHANTNIWFKVETNIEFLKMKNEKLSELYEDIEVAIERIEDKFDWKCDVQIKANRVEEIDITILVAE